MSATKKRRPVWTKQTVTIAIRTGTGTRDIEAEVRGLFAVHKTVDLWSDGWDVTHLPTGYATLTGARTKGAAKAFCVTVAKLLDWSKVEAPEGIKKMPSEVKQAIFAAIREARP